MDWLGKLLDTVTGGLPSAAVALCPEHLKKRWLERLSDHNPFKTISAIVTSSGPRGSHGSRRPGDLKEGKARSASTNWVARLRHLGLRYGDQGRAPQNPRPCAGSAKESRIITNRRSCAGRHHWRSRVGISGEHAGIGAAVTKGFTATLAALSDWQALEIPAIYQHIADEGLPTIGGGPPRPFGELVFAAFAEIIKDPQKYPQAREAFHIAMDKLGATSGRPHSTLLTGSMANWMT